MDACGACDQESEGGGVRETNEGWGRAPPGVCERGRGATTDEGEQRVKKKNYDALCAKKRRRSRYSPAIFFAHADCCAGEPSLNPCVKISRGPNRTSMGSGVSLCVAGIMVTDPCVCVVRRARLPLRSGCS